MEQLEISHTHFLNPGISSIVLPEKYLSIIKDECSKIMEDFDANESEVNNSRLAGQLDKEYNLTRTPLVLNAVINNLCREYIQYWTKRELTNHQFKIQDCWVNYQKKHEFNPIHDHNGMFSFVLWLQIPYDVEEELSLPHSAKSNSPCSSLFSFHYANLRGDISTHSLKVGKKHEGTLVLFPSWLKHSVNPFYTSDDFRISISGNIIPTTDADYSLFPTTVQGDFK